MKISIVGTGYVGLVTGACLAARGHDVTCVDVDPERVAALNAAKSPIFEAGLDDPLLQSTVGQSLQRDDETHRGRDRLRPDLYRSRHAVQRSRPST